MHCLCVFKGFNNCSGDQHFSATFQVSDISGVTVKILVYGTVCFYLVIVSQIIQKKI